MTERRPVVVYIAGAGRSGSTLLEGLLARRTGATAVGEIRLFLAGGFRWQARCECGQAFLECPFWSAVMESTLDDTGAPHRHFLEDTRRSLARNRSLRHLTRGRSGWSRDEETVARVHDRLYRSIAEVAGTPTIIDSSKTAAYGLFLAELGSIDLRVVHLVRDSRAVASSWQRHKVWSQSANTEAPPLMRTRSPAAAAREWTINNVLAALLRRRVRSAVVVRYEDLADSPDETVARIASMLDLRVHPASATGTGHGFLGNPVRFHEGPLEVRRDDAWIDELSTRDRAVTTLLTWPLLLGFGYRLRVRRAGGPT